MMHWGLRVIKGSLCEKVHRPRTGGSVSLNQLINTPPFPSASFSCQFNTPPSSSSSFLLSLKNRHVQWGFLAFQKCIQAFRSGAEKQNGHQGKKADLIKKQRMRDEGGGGGGSETARNSWHLSGFLGLPGRG